MHAPECTAEGLILKQAAGVVGVLQAGDDGEGQGEPEEGGHQPGLRVGEPGKEKLLLSKGIEEEPYQRGDTEADLEAGLP